ncbi:hypothetical protein [Patiriisocius hiemis]|uniref:Photosystem I assembly protein Ycf4 n=1 Tax=Patiriisocius hiemis TaxID=3075604 RepID=A0ABU2YBS9_9FLAO|nr:hypothetical protein [Constantimarinum sp. W242]MDT0555633.1 hypothetical protein [Constantimarinum sp. W242]
MTLKHIQPTPSVKIVFSIVISLFSFYALIQGNLFGLVLLAVGLRLGVREGIEMEVEGVKYRKIYSIFGINLGFWRDLPEIEYISLFKTTRKTRSRVITAEATLGFVVYRVNLFYEKNKHIQVYESDDRANSLEIAKHIATVLDVDIWDASKEEQEWLT